MVIAREALSFRPESLSAWRPDSLREIFAIYVVEDEKYRRCYRSLEDRFPFANQSRSRENRLPSPQIHHSVLLTCQ